MIIKGKLGAEYQFHIYIKRRKEEQDQNRTVLLKRQENTHKTWPTHESGLEDRVDHVTGVVIGLVLL